MNRGDAAFAIFSGVYEYNVPETRDTVLRTFLAI